MKTAKKSLAAPWSGFFYCSKFGQAKYVVLNTIESLRRRITHTDELNNLAGRSMYESKRNRIKRREGNRTR
jgi:hypothetical protein